MKTKKFLITAILIACSFMTVFAQEMTELTWEEYDFSFSVPSDFYVATNTETLFVTNSSDNQFSLEISPWSDASVTAEDVALAGLGEAMENWSDIETLAEDWVESGYESYYMIGTAYKDGYQLNFLIVGVINPDNDDNLYIRASWWDGEYNEYYEELAMGIVASFN